MEPQKHDGTRGPSLLRTVVTMIVTLYVFVVSINLLGHAFKLLGSDFAVALLETTADPFFGLFLGILATSIIQSSSTTTSITVGLVAAGGLSLETAIFVLMGANVGTTVTNTLVSFGHVTRRIEFRRAFSAAVVHDIFNVMSVAVLFPIELLFQPIQRVATFLQANFADIGGMELFDPISVIVDPAIGVADAVLGQSLTSAVVMIILSLVLLFISLTVIVRTMRSAVVQRAEKFIDRYLFGRDPATFLAGVVFTVLVQSSSVSTSIIVPLAGAGLLTLRDIFPFTLGANVGTTVTALLAALATGNALAVTAAFAHLLFNIYGIAIFYPLRFLPIGAARIVGKFAGQSKRNVTVVIGVFILLYLIPLAFFVF